MSDEPNSRGGSSSRFGSGSAGDSGQGGIFEPGSLISFTYEVESLLARGGMGEVYRTRHTEIGTEHAIKIVRPDLANNDKIMELFRREASVLRTVRDDAIVGYDGVLRDEEGRVYLVMEFVDGPSLTTFLEDRVLTLEEVRHLRDRLAHGLAAAHDKGVIHRDMSPDNIILGNGDLAQAKIIDFGIAKLADSSATTIIGDDFAGRYAYASPEQIGLYGGQVDARSDIYSLGLVLATAATGRALNMGEISESLVSVIEARKRIPDFSSVPEELRPELGSMLEPDPADRPQSMRDVIGLDQKLREAAEREALQHKAAEAEKAAAAAAQPAPAAVPQSALAAEPGSRPASASQGKKGWLVPAMAAGIAVIAAGGYFAWQQSGQSPQAPVAQAPAPAPSKPVAPQATAVAEAPAEAEALASGEVAPASGPAPTQEQASEEQAAEEAKAAEEARLAAEAKAAEEARLAEEAKAAEEARLAAEAKAAQEAKAAEEARLAAEAKAAEEARLAEEAKAAEEARLAAEDKAAAEAKAAEEARLAEEAKAAEEARLAAEAKAAEEARLAAEAKAAEEARLAAEAKAAEEARLAAEAKAAEEARLAAEAKAAEEARLAAEAKAAEEARLAAEAKAAEEARLAAEAKAAEEARLAAEAEAAAEAKAAEEAKLAAAAPAVDEVTPAAGAPAEEQVAALPEPSEAEKRLEQLKAQEAALSAEQRREIQRDLRALGHYSGGIDGSFGPGTRKGIRAYQQVAGADTTGYLLPETRNALAVQAEPLRAEEARRLAAEKAAAEKAAAQSTSLQAAADKAAAEQAAARARAAAQTREAPAGSSLQAALPNESEFDRVKRLAEGGDMMAQASLGQRYYRGRGVSKNLVEAARWTRKAAEQGEPRAQSNLGFYYMNGEGVSRDPAEAARWWRAAADQGLAQAQFNLGLLYEQGQGVAPDYAEAAKWYALAAEQGDRTAAARLDGLKRRNLIPGG